MTSQVEFASDWSSSLLRPGETCWRVANAERVAVIVDSSAYFIAAKAAMLKAERSILILGWDFDARTRLEPGREPRPAEPPDEIGNFLNALAAERPGLEIKLLIWRMPLPMAAARDFFPHRARAWFDGGVTFRLDASVPLGACLHQKVLVIDDALAFCGGGDLTSDRWDTRGHHDRDPRRRLPSGEPHEPRHEVMMLVDGDAAAALGDLARERWHRRTGERLELPPKQAGRDLWPEGVACDLRRVPVAIARTEPAWRGRPEIRESEALHLDVIASARRFLYFENQYFASPRVGEALVKRLAEPDGPEIMLVSSERSASIFDQVFMDRARNALIARLRALDRYGRFHAYGPRTRGGQIIIVHSKVTIADDRLLRVGSANLNNRSGGYDTECDLAVLAPPGPEGEPVRASILRFRSRLLAHYLGTPPERLDAAIAETSSPAGAIEALDRADARRFNPLPGVGAGPIGSLIAHFHLGDPEGRGDAWRPSRRRTGATRA